MASRSSAGIVRREQGPARSINPTSSDHALTPGVGVALPPTSELAPASATELGWRTLSPACRCLCRRRILQPRIALVGRELPEALPQPFLDSDIADRYIDVPLDAPYPIAAAARGGRVVLLPDLDSYEEEFSGLVADTTAAGVQATASLPLYRFDGTLLGAIGFAWAEPTSFDLKLEAALRAVASLCGDSRACRAIRRRPRTHRSVAAPAAQQPPSACWRCHCCAVCHLELRGNGGGRLV